MALVVDASVASKWFFQEDQSADAHGLLRGETLIAPDLVVAEVANVVWKRLGAGEVSMADAKEICLATGQLLDELVSLPELSERAIEIAHELRQPVYDCYYLALAERRDTVVVSADQRLIRKSVGTPWQARLEPLASRGRS